MPPPLAPDTAAACADRTIALQLLEERGRGAVLVGAAAGIAHRPWSVCPIHR